MKLRKILTFSLLFVFVLMIVVMPVNAAGLSFTKGEILNKEQIIDGVNWEKYKATSVTDVDDKSSNTVAGVECAQVVNMATIAPGAAKIISWAIPSGDGIKPSTLLAAAADFEATHPDYQVVAAVNNDYFGTKDHNDNDVPFQMYNASVIDGVVFRDHSRSSNMYGLAIGDNNEYKLTPVGGQIEMSEKYYLDVYDATNTYVIDTFELSGLNMVPEAGKTTLIYKNVVQADGYELFTLSTTANSKLLNSIYIEGKYNETVNETTSSDIAIATSNVEVANAIETGRKIRIYKTTAGEWAEYDSVLGCPAQTMKDGNILTVDEISDYGFGHVAARHPRTAIGFKADGTIVIMVIDGRQANDGMYGVSERENALALKNEGCINSFNFDGGGSSTFAVLINGKLTVTNSPSDAGGLRNDASHLLVVVPRATAKYNVTQELTNDGKVKVTGSVDITTQKGFDYSKAVLLVDGVSTGEDASNFEIELLPGQEYHLGLAVTYNNGLVNTTKTMCYEPLTTIGEKATLGVPSQPKVEFEKTNLGFVVNVSFENYLESVTKVEVLYDNKAPNVRNTINGFAATVTYKTEREYNFTIKYTYRTEICGAVTETIENVKFVYSNESKPAHQHTTCTTCGLCTDVNCDGLDIEKCLGHTAVEPTHEHTACPTCGLCTSSDCDGLDTEKCLGHGTTDKNPDNGSGSNCNFGAYASSMVASLGLVLLIFKKRK